MLDGLPCNDQKHVLAIEAEAATEHRATLDEKVRRVLRLVAARCSDDDLRNMARAVLPVDEWFDLHARLSSGGEAERGEGR